MPTLTLRQQAFEKVVDQLRLIKTTNSYTLFGVTANYKTNVGDSVHVWRSAPFQADELPGLIVRDLDEIKELSDKYGDREKRSLHIQITIAVADDTPQEELNAIFGDLDTAFGVGRASNWDGLVQETRPRIARTVGDQESLKIAGGVYEVYLDYATRAFYPYND